MICPNRTHNHNKRKKIRERANERGRERVKKERAAWGIEREKREKKERENHPQAVCGREFTMQRPNPMQGDITTSRCRFRFH